MRLVSVWVAWIVLVPALALGAPKAPKKAPAKKAPVTKPVTKPAAPAADPTTSPDAAGEPMPEKDGRTPANASPAGTAGGGGGAGSGPGNGGAGGGAGDAKADAGKEPAETDKPASGDGDVDTLRQEYLSLRDELFKSRARANAVASQLYSTRIQIKLTYTSGRYYNPVKASIRLDGASVYENATGAIAGDDGIRFDGYVAPGRHLVTFRVEAVGKDDDSFASVTESQITVKAVAGKDLVVAAKAKDGGDIAYEWTKKEKGSYGLALDVAVKTAARAEGDAKGAGSAKGAKK